MSAITWIVIVLIVISIIVTVTEVGLRFGILQKSKNDGSNGGNSSSSSLVRMGGSGGVGGDELWGRESVAAKLAAANITLEELRGWTAGLSEGDKGTVCGAGIVGRTWAGV